MRNSYCEEGNSGYKVRRWVEERTHSWMNRFRKTIDTFGEKGRELVDDVTLCLCADNISTGRNSRISSKLKSSDATINRQGPNFSFIRGLHGAVSRITLLLRMVRRELVRE